MAADFAGGMARNGLHMLLQQAQRHLLRRVPRLLRQMQLKKLRLFSLNELNAKKPQLFYLLWR